MAHRTCTRYTERPIQAHSSFMRAFTFCLLVIYGRHLTQDPRPSAPSQLSSPIKKGATNRSFLVNQLKVVLLIAKRFAEFSFHFIQRNTWCYFRSVTAQFTVFLITLTLALCVVCKTSTCWD